MHEWSTDICEPHCGCRELKPGLCKSELVFTAEPSLPDPAGSFLVLDSRARSCGLLASHKIAQAGLSPPRCWDHRYESPHPQAFL